MTRAFSLLTITITLFFLLDYFSYCGITMALGSPIWFTYLYFSLSIFVIGSFYKIFTDLRSSTGIRNPITNLLIGFAFAVLVTKLVLCFLFLSQDIGRFVYSILIFIWQVFGGSHSLDFEFASRNILILRVLSGLGLIPFITILYGITRGKYNYKVDNIDLMFEDLPETFDGFRVVQISDIHAGTFDCLPKVEKGVDLVNAQNADLILFTGDLVNSHKDEIDPYIDIFKKLQAPYGKYSVTGNHDYYGTYNYHTPEEKRIYWRDYYHKHELMGFHLLNNDAVEIKKDGASFQLLGVENWGVGPFPKKGNLDLAASEMKDGDFSILMSHDPTHWDHSVISFDKKIHLTLSGHTHGMQFGINVRGVTWSPVQYRYKRWIGLYEEAGRYLYVNRGFGFLGFPGRVGMRPEITVFTLRKSNTA